MGAKRAREHEHELEEALRQAERCSTTECSFCRDNCPSYRLNAFESGNPRGKNRVLAAYSEGRLDIEDLLEIVLDCAVCGQCSEACLADAGIYGQIPKVREFLQREGLIPEEMNASARRALDDGTPYPSKDRSWSEGLPEKASVGYFPGCNVLANNPKLAVHTVALLEREGVRPAAIDEHCCGSSVFNAGMADDFRDNAGMIAAEIKKKGVKRLITSCPGCTNVLVNLQPKVAKMPFKTVHITEFLASRKPGKALPGDAGKAAGGRVAYHDPCNLGRKLGITEEPRKIIEALGFELLEFRFNRARSACCGGGGGLGTVHPESSLELARDRVDEALAMGADALVSTCQTCTTRFARAAKGDIETLDLVEMIPI